MNMFEGECDPPPVDTSMPAEEQSRALTERAITLLSLIRAPKALEELGRAIALDPRNVAARHLRARYIMMNHADLALAEADAREAIAVAPTDPDLHATLAAILRMRGDFVGATAEIDRSLARKPDSADALAIKGELLLSAGEIEEAGRAFDRARTLAPDFLQAVMRDAQIQMELDEPRKAEEVLTALLDRSPQPNAFALRASARLALDDGPGALEDLGKAIGPPGGPYVMAPAGPVFTDLVLKRAMLLYRVGRGDEAMADMGAVLNGGDKPAILRIQLFLRRNGFAEVPLDGLHSDALDASLKACFLSKACGRSIVRGV
jgi:tetratricopeptide (TPR) repeat protein